MPKRRPTYIYSFPLKHNLVLGSEFLLKKHCHANQKVLLSVKVVLQKLTHDKFYIEKKKKTARLQLSHY